MLVVGLTGGAASGKSEVGKCFRELGADVLEADVVGHRLLEREDIKGALVATFGPEILARSGSIDRQVLGSHAFRDGASLSKLNAICHPPLLAQLRDAIAGARRRPPGLFVLIAALLVEWGLTDAVDRVVTVEASTETRKRRLMRRLGLDEREAERRIEAQIEGRFRLREADYVIDGSAPLEEMLADARRVWNQLRREAKLPAEGSVGDGVARASR